MTETWQNAAPPQGPPVGATPPQLPPPLPPPPAFPPPVSPYLPAGSSPGPGMTRVKLGALAGVGVIAVAGAWFAFGPHGSSPVAAAAGRPLPPAAHVAVLSPPPASVLAALPPAPTHDLDLGGSPTLAQALPKIELFVQESRGLRYKRPVAVTPLSNKAFIVALDKADGPDVDDPGGDATLKALHLVPASFRFVPDASQDDVGGFYDFKTKHLYVRSTVLNPLTQSILAHELTHALDDQYFDLNTIESSARNGDEYEARESLVEGDARWVEDQFSTALTDQRQAQESAERTAQFGGSLSTGNTPYVLELEADFPYDQGSDFIQEVWNAGGPAAVDAAFRNPPISTLQILDASDDFLHRVNAVPVARPAAPAGGRVIDHDTLGALLLASVLSEQSPASWQEHPTVLGWAGDAYVTSRKGAVVCVRDSIRTTLGGHRFLYDGLFSWAENNPGASVTVTGKTSLLLVSCTG